MTAADVPATQLDALQAILNTAHELAEKLTSDPLTERVLRVFAKLPPPDREPILKILERDATWCRIVEQTASETGITVLPNPHASLYVHVFGNATEAPSEPLRRDIDVIRFGIETFVRLLPLFFQEGVHEQWTASARELARDLDQELGECVVRLAREVLDLVAQPGGPRGEPER
jgi:hypothetical protein